MYNHEPKDYDCPLCRLVQGNEDEINRREYIVYEDEDVIAYVSPKWWPNNPGNAIVIPKEHTENVYDIPEDLLSSVYKTAKQIALAIKETYQCDGISTRQHNEPAGNQDVWHFHVHVFPRYENDNLYKNHDQKRWATHEERIGYTEKLKQYFEKK